MRAQKSLKMPDSLFAPLRDTPVLNYLPLEFLCGGKKKSVITPICLGFCW